MSILIIKKKNYCNIVNDSIAYNFQKKIGAKQGDLI